ncbi:hypothetical protein [Bartonella rattimassiliensis]|uniref:hypothetical protein n=1 Tax=Bartonella rattimassiliensis TaxID=270250 RepID=UPI000371262E|nr:hypothetical protein [Bartonella rattimassiliensis]
MDEKKSAVNRRGSSRFFYGFGKSFYPWKKGRTAKANRKKLKSIKVMSRYTRWIVLIILLLALDFSRLIDALVNIFTQKPNIRL